jgi:hypothetical protein
LVVAWFALPYGRVSAHFMFWLKKTENASTVAQMAKSQAIAMIAIIFASPGWHRARVGHRDIVVPLLDLHAID